MKLFPILTILLLQGCSATVDAQMQETNTSCVQENPNDPKLLLTACDPKKTNSCIPDSGNQGTYQCDGDLAVCLLSPFEQCKRWCHKYQCGDGKDACLKQKCCKNSTGVAKQICDYIAPSLPKNQCSTDSDCQSGHCCTNGDKVGTCQSEGCTEG